MKLFEFQGKRLFRQYGVPTPGGKLVLRGDDLDGITAPKVLKAQVLAGGRGKAGGVKVWRGDIGFSEAAAQLLGMTTIKGHEVRALLVEDKADILNEYYLSLTFDGGRATPLVIASAAGGVDIETVAAETPERIVRMPFDSRLGLAGYQVRRVAAVIGCSRVGELGRILGGLYELLRGSDASLVEINPLAETPDGLVALDAKVVLDDKAAFRHAKLRQELAEEQEPVLGPPREPEFEVPGTITYVPLSGTIGMISDGAGTGMLTLDLIKDAGGEAANFCEMGGLTSPQVMYDALRLVLQNPRVKSLLIVLIGGFNRMDEMAKGILQYREKHGLDVPMVVRMCGTMEETGKELMRQAGIPTHDDLDKTVLAAVRLAEEEANVNPS